MSCSESSLRHSLHQLCPGPRWGGDRSRRRLQPVKADKLFVLQLDQEKLADGAPASHP